MTRTYKEYPEAYFKILDHFVVSKEPFSLELEYGEALTRQRDLYRFFSTLHGAAADGDKFATPLSNMARDLVISRVPGRARSGERIRLIIKMNPLVLAMGGGI